jgi:hypothetical protein
VTKKDRQPLPFIDELLDDMAGNEIYTFCDGYSGYHQIKIHDEDVLKTTFTTPWRTFAYLRMPFSLCNAGGTFQRVQMKIFGPYIGKFIRVYLDDFAVYGNRSSHLLYVRVAFERLVLHKSSLSPEKCRLGFCEGALLGHVVTKEGIRVNPEKVKRILELRDPRNAREVATLWGMANYHNRFVPNLTAIAKPITSLIMKSSNFEWTKEYSEALVHIRECLTRDPVLQKPNWQKAFIVNPSASKLDVAAMLMQNDKVGRGHPIYYASRLLTPYEINYPSSEKLVVDARDGILRRAVSRAEAERILSQCHEGVCRGHFAKSITARKVLRAGYFWPTLFKDCSKYCRSCPACQAYGHRSFPYTELNPVYPTSAFEKWGVDFVGPLPKMRRRNEYHIVATDYLTKWAEATAVSKADKLIAAEFIYNQIVCRYGCPLEIVTDREGTSCTKC